MSKVRRLVFDVMKPHEPNIVDLSEHLAQIEKVDGVNIVVIEIDKEVENCKVTLEGRGMDYETIVKAIEDMSGSIHSIDLVVSGNKIVEEPQVPQD